MLRNYQKKFVVYDHGPGQVTHGVRGSSRGHAGQDHDVVNGQCSDEPDTKFVRFSFVGWTFFRELNR